MAGGGGNEVMSPSPEKSTNSLSDTAVCRLEPRVRV